MNSVNPARDSAVTCSHHTEYAAAAGMPNLHEHLRTCAAALLHALGQGSVVPNTYSTAWQARLRIPGSADLLFPAAQQWLLDHQLPTGAWGSTIPLPHDRIVSTLAAVVALASNRQQATAPAPAQRAIEHGCDHLHSLADAWHNSDDETIAFEMTVPLLLRQAQELSLPLPYAAFQDLAMVREQKLRLIPRNTLMQEPTTLLVALETLTDQAVNFTQLSPYCQDNGAMGNSPSSTGAYWVATGSEKSRSYMEDVASLHPDGGFPEIYPASIFEWAWPLHYLGRADLLPSQPTPAFAYLRSMLRDDGTAAYDPHVDLPDSDDTAMTLALLVQYGLLPRTCLKALLSFESSEAFTTYHYERNPSVSANARVLWALRLWPQRFGQQIKKAEKFLLHHRQESAYWRDKWHVSPYYATDVVVQSLGGTSRFPLTGTANWIVETQHDDGSWGLAGGNPEESSYAVLTMEELSRHGRSFPAHTWERAAAYLAMHINDTEFAGLWIGKGLYTPVNVVKSAVLAGYTLALNKIHGDSLCRNSPTPAKPKPEMR
ncbi:hypothetical protein ACIHFC_35975 [Streptomyces sp. NPDC052013]|uniref:hypothetical protein n=1 Tax=Streptomyces sp. NPDC052013 TaxID=3365679 RepID=UPI0037CD44FB